MKHGSTLILRTAVILAGIIALSICVFILPVAIISELSSDFDYLPLMIGLYIPAVPFFFALYQALKLLEYIDKNIPFSTSSVKALHRIKFCAIIISSLFAAGMPYIFYLADRDDAPGLAAIGFIIIFASFIIATFAAVLNKLFQSAIDLKAENELTV